MVRFSSKSSISYLILSIFWCSKNLSYSIDITGGVVGETMKLLIYQEDEEPCVHGINVYRNAVFDTGHFTQIYTPTFPGMESSFCMNYCIRTASCDAIFVAKSKEYRYIQEYNMYEFWYQFDWCAVYKINKNEVDVIDLTPKTSVPMIETFEEKIVPKESELFLIDFNACCPNKCPNNTKCTPSNDGSFKCISGFAALNWTGPEALVYLPFEDTIPDKVVGNFMLADGRVQKSVYLDGQTTVDFNIEGNSGCWREVSSCKNMGFSLSFWLQVISNSGFESHGRIVGVISAIKQGDKEGFKITILHWNSDNVLKFHVNDFQNHGQAAMKNIETDWVIQQWNHYTLVYQYTTPNDDANVLFNFYKNGHPYNTGYGHYVSKSISKDTVNKLAFGRKYINSNKGSCAHIMLDDVVIFNGSVDASMAYALYHQYQT